MTKAITARPDFGSLAEIHALADHAGNEEQGTDAEPGSDHNGPVRDTVRDGAGGLGGGKLRGSGGDQSSGGGKHRNQFVFHNVESHKVGP